jgi:hypothetical protein
MFSINKEGNIVSGKRNEKNQQHSSQQLFKGGSFGKYSIKKAV